MLHDEEGNNAIHYAVIYETCLDPLLGEHVKAGRADIDAYNYGKILFIK